MRTVWIEAHQAALSGEADARAACGAGRGTPPGQAAPAGQLLENQSRAASARAKDIVRAPALSPGRTLPSSKTREETVRSSSSDAAAKVSATDRNASVNIMKDDIGFKTAYVNGFQTDNPKIRLRLFYRTMSNELLHRIQARLKAVGLSESAASKAAGLSADTIRNLRRDLHAGKQRSMNAASLEALAPVLKTTAQWLLTGEGAEEGGAAVSIVSVPLVSWVSAGNLTAPDFEVDLENAPRLVFTDLPPGDWIALDVQGDSMNRISPDGSRILANRQDRRLVPNACYVVALESGEATYKRYRPDPDRFEPVSTNLDHEAIFPEGPVRIIGRVKRSIIDM